jgi:hypothetical protein
MEAMTSDQYTELVGFLGRKFEEAHRHAAKLFEQARAERAVMAEGFGARLDGIDARLDRMDVRFDGIDARLDRMATRFDGTLGDHERRMQALEEA